MKKAFLIFLILISCLNSWAKHIVGGEMIYQYIGTGSAANTKQYRITLKLFRDEHTVGGAAMPANVFIGIFNRDNNTQVSAGTQPYFDITKSDEQDVPLNPLPACITNAPDLHYRVGYYTFLVDLPNNNSGYTAAFQTCCRVSPLENVDNPGGTTSGSTYSCDIPPQVDSSPQFSTKIDVICQFKKFTLDFSSTDSDGDSLSYSFVEAYNGGTTTSSTNINPAAPTYGSVIYINGYTSIQPLGTLAAINKNTGIISGIAPKAGEYVVCVAVSSYKNGIFIAEHRKDFIVNIGNCDFAGAELLPKPVTCNGFSVSFVNDNSSQQNQTYFWDFGTLGHDTSNLPNPTFNFPDTGQFVVKLIVNKGTPCADSATRITKVYPGFFPGFTYAGQCKNTQIQFNDTTKTKYGVVDSWSWNFGDASTAADTSHIKNPGYSFSTAGNYDVNLSVTNSKGCASTITKSIEIKDKPDLTVTNDTLICSIDTLQLNAVGSGNIFWTPNYNINNQNNPSPLVSPKSPTTYYVSLTDPFGCKTNDSVFVNVKQFVTLDAGRDTGICQGDAVQLNPISDALHYKWSPSTFLNSDTAKFPIATPPVTTTFFVIGNIGKCQSNDNVTIRVTPYPASVSRVDTALCLGNSIQFNASGGSTYTWSPAFFLNNPNIPNPITNPNRNITYIVSIRDTLGCPKPVFDTVTVKVQKITADAGPRDTSIVINQPLQLNATGGQFYLWQPSAGLNNNAIANPIAIINNNIDYVVQVSNAAGCLATDTISVKVFKVLPGLYVPNVFSPNGDGKNDVFRPIPIGLKQINYFKVFNRWGQLVFSTTEQNKGWDGTFKGRAQDAAVFVWIAEGIDYEDKKITQKGIVTLIR